MCVYVWVQPNQKNWILSGLETVTFDNNIALISIFSSAHVCFTETKNIVIHVTQQRTTRQALNLLKCRMANGKMHANASCLMPHPIHSEQSSLSSSAYNDLQYSESVYRFNLFVYFVSFCVQCLLFCLFYSPLHCKFDFVKFVLCWLSCYWRLEPWSPQCAVLCFMFITCIYTLHTYSIRALIHSIFVIVVVIIIFSISLLIPDSKATIHCLVLGE